MSSHSHGRGKQEGEFEVTGVSRSGRVRKKSSKLMDFESPEEIERQARKQHGKPAAENRTPASSKRPAQHLHQEIKRPVFPDMHTSRLTQVKETPVYSESDSELGLYPAPGDEDPGSSLDSLDSEDDDDLDGAMTIDDRSEANAQPQGSSLYMLERAKKKKLIMRDGKVVEQVKAVRKDKGKARFTAYMTWAKEVRSDLMKQHPELDFSQTSRKLSDLWATVPMNEKYVWKKRAKRLADDMLIKEKTKKMIGTNSRKFINKQHTKPPPVSSPPVTTSKGQKIVHLGQPSVIGKIPVSPPDISRHRMKGGEGLVQDPVLGTGLYKVVGTQPIDLAAHLRLLGESLNIIGERLKEHEGQIAVSGSYSVLLDSLICALGPLMCLMQQVGETNIIPNDKYAQVLDNIAYIMPGL